MIVKKVKCLTAAGLLLLISAAPQATPVKPAVQGAAKTAAPAAAAAQDLVEHPEILTMDFSPSTVSLFGVHVGDKTAKVPVAKMDRNTGTLPGIMKMVDSYQFRYNVTTLTVTALVVSNRSALIKAGLQDKYDVEFRFGKPDISDDRHAVYLNRRLLATFNNSDINTIEIR
jgi:hypothetical protein